MTKLTVSPYITLIIIVGIVGVTFYKSQQVMAGDKTQIPQWVKNKITQFKQQPIGNPPREVWQYTIKDKLYFYFPAQCCNLMSQLYDQQGKKICSPDGGITGKGDKKCPNLLKNISSEQLVWRDRRSKQ